LLDQTFVHDLALKATLKAGNTRNNHPQFGAENLTDHDRYSYWGTDDTVTRATVELSWKEPVTFRLIRLRENIQLGQRIERVEMDVLNDEGWSFLAAATSIGSNRLILLPAPVTCKGLRIRIVQSPVCIALSEISIY
jgi:alpha-L-fucosidase